MGIQYYSKKRNRFSRKQYKKFAGGLLIGLGLLAFTYLFAPVILYQAFIAPVYAKGDIAAPIPTQLVAKENNIQSLISERLTSLTADTTDARTWYPKIKSDVNTKVSEKAESYLLSIPKLNIENAVVSTTNYDLAKNLIQYPGTSTPPNKGNAVVFGHSTLPSMFDPKNYKAIFATLHTIKIGDEIGITVSNINYKYIVFSITITTPEDTSMLTPLFDGSYLTIVTCTPPGTTWKRLIVKSKLIGS